MVVRQGMGLAVVGVAVGLVLAVIGTRALRSQLYAVRSTDPVTISSFRHCCFWSPSWPPISRPGATRVDPLVTLRAE
jgi:putative ABC transport system permease protein